MSINGMCVFFLMQCNLYWNNTFLHKTNKTFKILKGTDDQQRVKKQVIQINT